MNVKKCKDMEKEEHENVHRDLEVDMVDEG
jgi:hypothetical protein